MATDFKGLTTNSPPAMPFWWFIVQIVTCVLGLGMFIVACYCIHVLPGGGPQAFLLFDALMIWAVVGGFLAIQRFQPSLYYRIGFVSGYALLIIFVLAAWAWSASVAGPFLSYSDSLSVFLGSDYGNPWKGLGAGLAVGAAIGAIVWVLLIVSLVFFVMHCLRDGGDGIAAPRSDAEMGAVKVEQPAVAPQQTYEADPNQQQYQQYPPQQYPPQQQQPQQYPPQQHQGPYQS